MPSKPSTPKTAPGLTSHKARIAQRDNALSPHPTSADVKRALANLDVKLDRAERRIDGLLEHQARRKA